MTKIRSSGLDDLVITWYNVDVNSGIKKIRNRIGKAAKGSSCFRAFQKRLPSVIGWYPSLEHTLKVILITMATMAIAISNTNCWTHPQRNHFNYSK